MLTPRETNLTLRHNCLHRTFTVIRNGRRHGGVDGALGEGGEAGGGSTVPAVGESDDGGQGTVEVVGLVVWMVHWVRELSYPFYGSHIWSSTPDCNRHSCHDGTEQCSTTASVH